MYQRREEKVFKFEKTLKSFITKRVSIETLRRINQLTAPFSGPGKKGLLASVGSFFDSAVRAFSRLDTTQTYVSSTLKIQDQVAQAADKEMFHLNSELTCLDSTSQIKIKFLRIGLSSLSKGTLKKQNVEYGYDGSPCIYSFYEYKLENSVVWLIHKEEEGERGKWLTHVFSSEPTLDLLISDYREWFWGFCENNIFFTCSNNTVIPVIQPSLKDVDKFIGEFGPEELYEYWQNFSNVGISRSLLFVGPPGTGKTSTVRGIAKQYDLRLAKVNSHMLGDPLDEESFSIWYDIYRPSLILLDDVHGIGRTGISAMLSMLEYINNRINTKTMVIGTANKLHTVDIALRRPGRFDAIFTFNGKKYEKEILEFYAEKYGVVEEVSKNMGTLLKQVTNKLTPAYMKEIVKTIRALSGVKTEVEMWDFIEQRIKLMVDLSKDDGNSDKHVEVEEEKKPMGFGFKKLKKLTDASDGTTPERRAGF